MQGIACTVGDPIDGDSVILVREDGKSFNARIGGIDVPSRGWKANRAKKHIRTWRGRKVTFKRGCCGTPHGETPGSVIDSKGNNLGRELWSMGLGRRLHHFPIDASLPSLSRLNL